MMEGKRIILELGASNNLHGGDYTKAATRAVEDALRHSSLSLIASLGLKAAEMRVHVTIGVAKPEKVDEEAVKAALPRGRVAVTVQKGGLDVPDEEGQGVAILVSAAIAVYIDL